MDLQAYREPRQHVAPAPWRQIPARDQATPRVDCDRLPPGRVGGRLLRRGGASLNGGEGTGPPSRPLSPISVLRFEMDLTVCLS